MSGIAGILHLDGEPAGKALVAGLASAMAHRGADGIHSMASGPVAMAHLMLCTTPESLHETQPLLDESGRYCLVADARIDNGAEVREELGRIGVVLRDDTDAEIILKACTAWGQEAPARLIGDFAFAIWDSLERSLFCARDHIGIRPFFYYCDGRRFIWASEAGALLACREIRVQINEGMVAEYLADEITHLEETLYSGILRIPGAHALVVRNGAVRKLRYWDIDPARQLRYRTRAEYEEHFHQVFVESIRCRLRSQTAVGAELSGGVDSSSVVAVAQRLINGSSAPAPSLTAFSLAFPGLPCDESPYIREVVRHCSLSHQALQPQIDAAWPALSVASTRDYPDIPNGYMLEPIMASCGRQGIRVLLTGLGGDEWMNGRRVVTFQERLRALAGKSPLAVRGRQVFVHLKRGIPGWVAADFAQRISFLDRIAPAPEPRRFSTHQLSVRRKLTDGHRSFSLQQHERFGSRFPVEYRHPFHDRRIVEFVAATPPEIFYWRDRVKPVLRAAVTDLLPPAVSSRTTKAEFSIVFNHCYQAYESNFRHLAIAGRGWVNQPQVSALYAGHMKTWSTGARDYLPDIWPLWMVLGIEIWYTIREREEYGRCTGNPKKSA